MTKYHNREVEENILNEPSAIYLPSSLFELSSRGISKSYIKRIISLTGLSVVDFLTWLPISMDTYKRKSQFGPMVTEKVLEIEEVYRRGLDVFGESFYQWMNTPNVALEGREPSVLLSNSFGTRMLLDKIGQIEHGILA